MSHCYCSTCGAKNPSNLAACTTCGCATSSTRNNPVNTASFRSTPMAIFDIDDTILDNNQRFKDARRAGYIDKDGKALRKRKLETPGAAYKRRNEFLYSPENLRKDRAIPGARDLINLLMAEGYIIAYVTSRPAQFNDNTKRQLEEKDFPIFKDNNDADLLFSKGGSETSPAYKRRIVGKLKAMYDVRLIFDDKEDNLVAMGQEGIPGLYSSIRDYTKYLPMAKTNSSPYSAIPLPGDSIGPKALPNPPLKPRRKKMSNGKYRKEPAKSYVKRFMGDSKMNGEFPDNGQRYAVALHYVDQYYGKSGLKSVGATLMNPGEEYSEDYMVPRDVHKLHMAGARIDDQYEEGEEVPEWWKSKLSVTADNADNLADALEYTVKKNPANPSKVEKAKKLYKHMNGTEVEKVEKKKIDMGDVWYQVGEGGCWQIGYMSGKETGSSSQKYTHTFNEETQDGNFPKLYATMPESGKPMLVIMGGTWKIKTDDQGVAWIYD